MFKATRGILMDIHFIEVGKSEIREAYPSYFHEQARYFKAMKDGNPLCFYGVISRTFGVGEAFLMMKTFNGVEGRPPKVLSKGFFVALFAHADSLRYKELYTWTKWDRLIKLFARFEKLGITKTDPPFWDEASLKTWFMKRV
jgi:hypothetical protein